VAEVVGTNTAGVGTLPGFHSVGDDLILQLADIWLRAPGGLAWQGDGLAPDVLVQPVTNPVLDGDGSLPPDLQRAAAFRLVRGPSGGPD
jgi:C-terminal processing protease CtpA/Prc